MASAERKTSEKTSEKTATVEQLFFSHEELIELRRNTLRYARTFPIGAERNQHRQIAASLRALFRNKQWLAAHTRG